MPELPEVQILVNQLAPRLKGARIREVEVCDLKIKLRRDVVGRRILQVRRRGKNIIFDLSGGLHLLVHLRMTGWFEFDEPKHYRAAIRTGKATAYFEDGRRFGTMQTVTPAELENVLKHLGPDPLADHCDLSRLLKTSRPVKVALLDQRLVAGVGNIYASESLWRARINPRRRADRVRPAEVRELGRGINKSMRRAISHGHASSKCRSLMFMTEKGNHVVAVALPFGGSCRRNAARISVHNASNKALFWRLTCFSLHAWRRLETGSRVLSRCGFYTGNCASSCLRRVYSAANLRWFLLLHPGNRRLNWKAA